MVRGLKGEQEELFYGGREERERRGDVQKVF